MINVEKIKEIQSLLHNETIVAATKYVDSNDIIELMKVGINNIGENRVDSFLKKYEELNSYPLIWHFIGTLQTNKVSDMINKIDYLHSLDNLRLAEKINRYRITPLKCFVEVNVTKEDTKHGLYVENLEEFLHNLEKYDKIEVVGLMTMAPNTLDIKTIDDCFSQLKALKEKYNLPYLSMGMSNDYEVAIKNGTSFLRLGRILFEGEDK